MSAAATDSWTIGLGRVVSGAGFLFSTLYFTKMAADWFVGREIATAMSILVMSWPFGIAMGQVGHAWLAEAYGWRVPFQVASAYCILASLAVLVFYRPPPDLPNATPSAAARLTAYEWRLVILAAIAWATFNGGYVVYLAFGPKVLEAMGQSAIGAAGIISVGSWVMILSGALCGQIADRFGRRDLILAVCMAGAVIALVLLNIPQAGLAANLLFGLVGMAPAGVIMALTGEAMRPEQRAFGMGVFFTVYYAIMLVTPPIAGAIFDATGRAGAPSCSAPSCSQASWPPRLRSPTPSRSGLHRYRGRSRACWRPSRSAPEGTRPTRWQIWTGQRSARARAMVSRRGSVPRSRSLMIARQT